MAVTQTIAHLNSKDDCWQIITTFLHSKALDISLLDEEEDLRTHKNTPPCFLSPDSPSSSSSLVFFIDGPEIVVTKCNFVMMEAQLK